MMNRRWLATTMFLLLPSAAGAEQLELGVRSQAGWTDNVYGTSDDAVIDSAGQTEDLDTVDDYSVRIGPWARVSDPDGDLTWSVRYQPSYEFYMDESDLRDFDHDASADVAWRVAERTTLFASENFRSYSTLTRFNENAGTNEPAVLRGRRDELTGSFTSVGLQHRFTPLDVVTASLGYNDRNYELSSDVTSVLLATRYLHQLSSRTSIGLSGSWSRQTFTRAVGSDAVTNYYSVSGVLEHRFSRTLALDVSVGPALIDPDDELVSFSPQYGVARGFGGSSFAIDAANCPLLNDTLPEQPDVTMPNYNPRISSLGFGGCAAGGTPLTAGELQILGYPRGDPLVPGSVAGGSAKLTEFDQPFTFDQNGQLVRVDDGDFGESDLTYFASVGLRKDWERWHADLSYNRSANDSGSFGSSSVQDTFQVNVRWEPARLWTLSLTGAYSLIDQSSDFVTPSLLVLANEPVPSGVTTVGSIATVQRVVVNPSDDEISYRNVSVAFTATRRLTERSSAFASVYWYQQNQERDIDQVLTFLPGAASPDQSSSRWNNLTLWVGIDWHFDPIRF